MNIPHSQYKLEKPYNIILYLCYFSPIILITLITFLSFVFQNFKGFIYLGFIFAAVIIRYYTYYLSSSSSSLTNKKPIPQQNEMYNIVCNSIMFSSYGNITFSIFVFSFTCFYLFLPMFINGYANFSIFSVLILYGLLDIFIKYYNSCYKSISYNELIFNFLGGSILAIAFVMSLYQGGSSKYLFFNEMNTGADVCYAPSNQQFKCKVYKNGELVGNTSM